jgi:hypothetical protein
MSERPWMKFFSTDWRSDPALRLCSRAARGTWIDMLSIMHEAEPYGELRVNGAALGEGVNDITADIAELERNGVFSRRKNGVIYSRRMESDENRRRKMRENGKKGGNPSLSKQTTIEPLVIQEDKTQRPEARGQIPDSKEERGTTSVPSPSRGTRVPDSFPGQADIEACSLPADTATREAEKFRNYFLGAPGQKGVKRDWPATWRNWVMRAEETGGGRGPPKPKGPSFLDIIRTAEDYLRDHPDEPTSQPLSIAASAYRQ